MENKWTIMPWSTRLAVLVMVIALFALLFIARKHPEQQTVEEEHWMWCTNAMTISQKMVDDCVVPMEEQASTLRELGCYEAANWLELNWQPSCERVETVSKYNPIDDNLTDVKQETRWRLNSNGYSQRHLDLTGTTRQERIVSLLNQYGFDWEDTWYVLRTIGRIYRVYPETIVCIAYADSSLGRFLKTEHNYGNVGNNDRWDTVSYSNMEQGFNAIAKTLNNQYLWGYNHINELSRYGNPDWMVYATSPENWHINVTNCLGMIYDKWVQDDWYFRF